MNPALPIISIHSARILRGSKHARMEVCATATVSTPAGGVGFSTSTRTERKVSQGDEIEFRQVLGLFPGPPWVAITIEALEIDNRPERSTSGLSAICEALSSAPARAALGGLALSGPLVALAPVVQLAIVRIGLPEVMCHETVFCDSRGFVQADGGRGHEFVVQGATGRPSAEVVLRAAWAPGHAGS